ncbi:hypothetical protein DM02DRAFT_680612 [Periconia macrospinosa]|uniref:Heme oxygenase-like protein n=1 Tax=Periconia macrospinosa TaxID=97972 RepID=A0A2V1DM23_9PLEO|nr:hypothetical protein DM02DRAFT_680612 [Periconia macrospinosa]
MLFYADASGRRRCSRRFEKTLSPPTFNLTPLEEEKLLITKAPRCKTSGYYQDLYFRIQNIERFPEVREPARDELLNLLSDGITNALKDPEGSIIRLQHYDEGTLWKFIRNEHDRVMQDWGAYLERRENGGGPLLFSSIETARSWLIKQAPVKLIDGAWLAHIHKITTPFALRGVTKDAWQVFSEELGDGDVTKHHVHLYTQLLEEVGSRLPACHSVDFINSHHWHGVDNTSSWKGAVGELVISLFPHEFLPEILGFNMHYELVTLETLCASYELRALAIDPKYFFIHVSIDNADSGHTAMAARTVIRYLEIVRSTAGEESMQIAWKRIQAGYVMSWALASQATHHRNGLRDIVKDSKTLPTRDLDNRIIGILKAKALVSQGCHFQSRARIAGRSLSEWLAPNMWNHHNPQLGSQLLAELSKARPWVYAGASSKSLLLKELEWGGRMFGAFTNDEVTTLRMWIDSLAPAVVSEVYWSFTSRTYCSSREAISQLQDPTLHYPVTVANMVDDTNFERLVQSHSLKHPILPGALAEFPTYSLSLPKKLPSLSILWFAHIGLLENTINIPSLSASPLYASILRILRAQAGFSIETEIVASMDEMNRRSHLSLVDIGLEIVSCVDEFTVQKPTCIHDLFVLLNGQTEHEEAAKFAKNMLCWALRPTDNIGWLLGMALAFISAKRMLVEAPELLAIESRLALESIVVRETLSLRECVSLVKEKSNAEYARFAQGYLFCSVALKRFLS